jgi:hypothetical protein
MLKSGDRIELYGKTVTVITATSTEALIQKDNIKQPQWVSIETIRLFNKI